ncbi:Tfp pilus assembly protein PilF [Novosphingobium sp. B1]|nr:Tfp pilus assembly protein PilF [Novosphingobium sp. B1]
MWNCASTSLSLALVLALAACGDSAADKLARARQELADMELAAARVDLASVLAEKGDDPAPLLMLAEVQLRLGDGDGAAATAARLERVAKTRPEVRQIKAEAALLKGDPTTALALVGGDQAPAALRIRASALLALDDNVGALAALRQGAAKGGDARLLADYARFLIDAGDLAGADQQIAALQKARPDDLDGYLLSADVAARRGRYDAAHMTLAKAAGRYPRIPDPLLARATTYDLQGKLDAAVAMTAKAAELAPDDTRVRDLQVQFASMKGEWEKVRALLSRQEKTFDPISANGLSYAEAMLRTGHPEQARAMFHRALTRSPNNPFSRVMLAEAQLVVGDAASAYTTVLPLAQSVLAGPREIEIAAKAAEALNRPDTAAWRARLVAANEGTAAKLAGEGQAALAREDWQAAVAAYRQLLQLGEDADVHKRLALALSHSGQPTEAIRSADRARALRPDDPDTVYVAGLVRVRGGLDRTTGLALLRQATEAAPGNVVFQRSLATYGAQGGG